jgi:hypothetical protein
MLVPACAAQACGPSPDFATHPRRAGVTAFVQLGAMARQRQR